MVRIVAFKRLFRVFFKNDVSGKNGKDKAIACFGIVVVGSELSVYRNAASDGEIHILNKSFGNGYVDVVADIRQSRNLQHEAIEAFGIYFVAECEF